MAANVTIEMRQIKTIEAYRKDWEKNEMNVYGLSDGQVLEFNNAHWMEFYNDKGPSGRPLQTIVLVDDNGINCFKSWTKPRYFADKDFATAVPLGHYGDFIDTFKKVKDEVSQYLLGKEVKDETGKVIPPDTLDAPDLIAKKYLKGKKFIVSAFECRGYSKEKSDKKTYFTRYHISETS